MSNVCKMTKENFEDLIGHEISTDRYFVVLQVYNFHPFISRVTGVSDLAMLYNCFGYEVIEDMFVTAILRSSDLGIDDLFV